METGNEANEDLQACQFPEDYPDDFVVMVARAFLQDHYNLTPGLPGLRRQIGPREWVVPLQTDKGQIEVTVKWKNGRSTARGNGAYPDICEYFYTCLDPGRLELRRGVCLDGNNPYQ